MTAFQMAPTSGSFWASSNCKVSTNTTNNHTGTGILVDMGALANSITGNTALGDTIDDLADSNPNCDNNKWKGNKFTTRNRTCIQ